MASLDTIRRVTIQATGADGIERIAAAYQSAADAEAHFASAADKVASSTDQAEKRVTSVAQRLESYFRAIDPATKATADFERKVDLLKRGLNEGLFGAGEAGARAFRVELDRLRATTDQTIGKIVEMQRAQERAKVAAGFQSMGAMGRTNMEEFDAARRISSMNTPDPAIERARQQMIERARADQMASVSQLSISERYGIGGRSAVDNGASFSALEERAAQQQVVEEARARQAAMDAQASINQRFGIGGQSAVQGGATYSAFEDAARDAEKFEQQLKLLKLEIDPLGAALDRLNEELLQYQALADAGLISTQELAAAQGVAQSRYQQSAAQIAAVGRAGQMTTGQLVGMQYQLNDIAVSAASGQNLGTVFMQQGMQISQQFAPGTTLASAGSTLAAGFTSMLTPINLAVAGVAALGYAVSYFSDNFESNVKPLADILEQQAKAVETLRDSYSNLADDLGRVGRESLTVQRYLADLAAGDSQKALQRETFSLFRAGNLSEFNGKTLGQVQFDGGNWLTGEGGGFNSVAVDRQFAPIEKEVEAFFQTIRAGTPDVMGFREAIQMRAQLAPTNEALKEAVNQALRWTETMKSGQAQTDGFKKALEDLDQFLKGSVIGRAFEEATNPQSGRMAPGPLTDTMGRIGDRAADEIAARLSAQETVRGAGNLFDNAGLTEYERRLAEINQRYDELRRQAQEIGQLSVAGPLIEEARLKEIAAAALEVSTAWRLMTEEFERQTELMQNQIGLWGQSVDAIERYRAAVELLTEARRNDGVISEEERRRAFELADAQGAAARAVADAEYQRSEAMKDANEAAGTGRTLVSGLIADLRAQADAATIALNALNRLADRMLDAALDDVFRAPNPNAPGGIAQSPGGFGFNLFAKMFGAPVPAAGTGAPSDQALVDQVMGNAITASTVNVTAATVNVNGYAPVDGGIPFPGADGAGMPSPVGGGSPAAAGAGRYSVPGGGSIPSDIDVTGIPGVASPSGGGLYGPPLPPADPTRFLGAFDQFTKYQFPNRFQEAHSRFMWNGQVTDAGDKGSVPFPTVYTPPGYHPMGDSTLPRDNLPGFNEFFEGRPTPAAPSRFDNAFGQFGIQPAAPSRFDDAFGQFPAGSMAAPPVFPGAPLFSPAADGMASAASAAQQATQSFGELGGVLGAATPQAGALGQAIAGAFSGGSAGGAPGGGLFDILGGLIGGGTPAPMQLAGGGPVRGPGTETSDSIPAWLSDGEFIVNAKQARKHRSLLDAINDNTIMAFAAGGEVGGIPGYAMETMRSARRGGGGESGRSGPLVEIIDQRRKGSPDVQQKTLMGPNGEQRLRILIRDENAKSNAPGGLNDKNLSARSIRRPYVPR